MEIIAVPLMLIILIAGSAALGYMLITGVITLPI